MNKNVKKQNRNKNDSAQSAIDDKMRLLLRKNFPTAAWIGGLPTVREFFAAIFDRYGDRLSDGTKPELDLHDTRREIMFLENLEEPIKTIQNREMTLRDLYMESICLIGKQSPPLEGMSTKNQEMFRNRVAQYMHRIRTARKATT